MTSFPVLMSNILWLVIVYIFTLLLLEHSGNTELKARKALSEKKAHCQTYGLEVHQNTYHLNSQRHKHRLWLITFWNGDKTRSQDAINWGSEVMQGIWTPQPFSFPQRHEGWFALGSRLCTLINSPPSESLHTPPVPFTLDPWPLGNNSADQTVANPKTQLYWAVVFSWGVHSDGGQGLMYGTTWLSVFGSCCNTYLEAEYKCKLGSWSYEIARPKVKA